MNDDPIPLPVTQREIDDAVDAAFDANRTIPSRQGQMFSFQSEKNDVEVIAIDPIVRLEQKVDAVMHTVDALKRKVDSMDSVLARIIHR